MRTAIYPGSFDPITRGHVDQIERAAGVFDTLHVVILHNVNKTGAFSVEERLDMIRIACSHLANVQVSAYDGLLVDCAQALQASAVVRGLRSVADFEYELHMAQLNRSLAPKVDTFFLMTAPEYAHISSGAVREIAAFGGDVAALVPQSVLQRVRTHYAQKQ